MAELSIDSVVTPEKDELDEGSMSKHSSLDQDSLSNGRSTDTRHSRTSVGSNALRNSAEKSESAKSSTKVVPHYLRASTGSCHDHCKYGREHSFETKPWKPLRKSIAKMSPVQIFISGGKEKEDATPDGKEKEYIVSDGKKKKENVASADKKKKEDVGSVDKTKKEEVVSAGKKKKEDVDSVGKKKKKAEVISSVGKKKKKKKDEVSVGKKKKEDGVSNDNKEGEKQKKEKEDVVLGAEEKEEEVLIGQSKDETINDGSPIDTKDESPSQKPSPDTKSSPTNHNTSLDRDKARKSKPSTYTNKHSSSSPSSRNKSNLQKLKLSSNTKTTPSKQNDSSGSRTLLPKGKPSSAKKFPSADPPEIIKSVVFPYTEDEESAKQGSPSDCKISRTEKRTGSVAKKLSSPGKLAPVKVKPSSSCDDSDVMGGKGGRNSNGLTGRESVSSKASAKKTLTPSSATQMSKLSLNKTAAQIKSGKSGNLKLASSPKVIRRVSSKASKGEKVTEKTLHVIRVETEKNVESPISSPPSPSSAKPSPYAKPSSLSSDEEDTSESEESAVETGKKAPVQENIKQTMRKSRVVLPEDKCASPVKLKFRMGKVVNLQSDNNAPRRLRFGRARALAAEGSKGDLRRKISKRAGVSGDAASTGASSEKVVLKHQDVQGKKDAQGLLNKVIEVTASKLALSRKSKVKALVGAFETVISLQELKPSTQVVS